MATGHVERRGKRGWNTLVIDYGEYIDKSQDPPKVRRRREKTALPLGPGQTYMKKDDAEAILRDKLTEINRGTYVKPSGLTVAEFLERWLESCRQRQVPAPLAPATLDNYEMCVRHVVGELGKASIDDLLPLQVQDFYSRWLAAGRHPRTVEQVHQVLHVALAYGVKKQTLARNVLDFVDPPRPKRRKVKAYGPAELWRLMEAARGTSLLPLIAVAANTGLRRGELLGLRWENVDLMNGLIHVREMRQRIKRKNIVKPPKTEAGERTVPLNATALATLQDLQQRNPHELVFCKPDGSPYDPSYITHRFPEIARKAGLDMRLHDLRHMFATLGLLSGASMRAVQELLGHEREATTSDIYTHVLDEVKRQAVDGIGRTIERNSRHQSGTKSEPDGDDKGKD